MPCNSKKDFQEVLDEIDMGLSKFDGQNTVEPLSAMTGLALPSDDSNSPEVHHSSVTDGVTPLGGQIRVRIALVDLCVAGFEVN